MSHQSVIDVLAFKSALVKQVASGGSRCGNELLRRSGRAGGNAVRLPGRKLLLLSLLYAGMHAPLFQRRHWLLRWLRITWRQVAESMAHENNLSNPLWRPNKANVFGADQDCRSTAATICAADVCFRVQIFEEPRIRGAGAPHMTKRGEAARRDR